MFGAILCRDLGSLQVVVMAFQRQKMCLRLLLRRGGKEGKGKKGKGKAKGKDKGKGQDEAKAGRRADLDL